MTGVYVPGDSLLHRLPAAAKLLLLAAGLVLVVRVGSVPALAVAIATTAGLYTLARIPPRLALAQVRPLLWFALLLLAFQALLAGWERAVVVTGALVVAVALASLVTLTTRVTAMLDALERAMGPLRRFGVDPERVALVLALGVRAVPVIAGLAGEVRDAQRARGLTASPRAYAVPLLVRTLRHADALGEALVARGLDD